MNTAQIKKWTALLTALLLMAGLSALSERTVDNSKICAATIEEEAVEAGEVELYGPELYATSEDNPEIPSGRLPEGLTVEAAQSDQENGYGDSEGVYTANVAISTGSFPDKAFREYIQRFDMDGDGVLSSEECEAVNRIYIRNQGVSSLKGIEHFSNLQYLDVRGNVLTNMNLSSNTALLEVECSENQLTGLSVSMLTELKKLCCYKNRIARMNLSQNTSLEYLDCQGNGMVDLYLGENYHLDTVICFDNQLSQLDLSCVENITYLDCWNNKLKKLDVTGHAGLRRLRAHGNPMKTLDLEDCNELHSALEETPVINSYKVTWGDALSIPMNTKLLIGEETVYQPGKPKSVSLNYKKKSMKTGETLVLIATIKPAGVLSACTWKSSNTSVATVSSDGVVTAKAKGTATITVKTANGKKATCKVTVSQSSGNRIEVKEFIEGDCEETARRLGLYFHRECYQDADETIYVFPSDYDYDRVYMIGLLNGNKKHCIEGVYVGMSYSTAKGILISKGYSASVEDRDGTTVYVYDNGNRIIDHVLINGKVDGLYIKSYEYEGA